MTSRLSIYNGALTEYLKETPLAALTDNVPNRFALDDVWDRDGLRRCLAAGQWNFAARSLRIEYDEEVTPAFGYQYSYLKPDDYVRLLGISTDVYFRPETQLTDYRDEGGRWWADVQPIYVRYVSSDDQYGLDLSKWPATFTEYVQAWFAWKIAPLEKADAIKRLVDEALDKAQNLDAFEQPSAPPQSGTWTRARRGSTSTSDRGSRTQLIG